MRFSRACSLILLTACGGGGDDPPPELPQDDAGQAVLVDSASLGEPVRELDLDAFLRARTARLCHGIFTCVIANDDWVGARAVLQTQERCERYYGPLLARSVAELDLRSAIAEGTTVFDPERAAACTALPFSCDTLRLAPEGLCAEVFRGTHAVGSTCFRSEECVPGTFCDNDSSFTCPALCAAKHELGAECENDGECAGGSYCDYRAEPSVCSPLPAASERAALGEACGLVAPATDVICGDGAFCDWADAHTLGTCRAALALGASCSDVDTPCEGVGACVGELTSASCQEMLIMKEGEPCDDGDVGFPLRACDPLELLHCVAGRCEQPGDGGPLSGCVEGDWGELTCPASYFCDRDLHTCQPLRAEGLQCDENEQCLGGCDYDTGVCAARACFD